MGDLSRRIDPATPPPPPATVPVRHPVDATLRLLGWGWVLVRHDALVPREVTPLLPVWVRWIAHLLHAFAGREGREGRPGQRLGRAFEHLGPVAIKRTHTGSRGVTSRGTRASWRTSTQPQPSRRKVASTGCRTGTVAGDGGGVAGSIRRLRSPTRDGSPPRRPTGW